MEKQFGFERKSIVELSSAMIRVRKKLKERFKDGPLLAFLRRCSRKAAFLLTLVGGNLSLLAVLYGTDKYGPHNYTQVYQKFMSRFRRKRVKLLEIGIGGYETGAGGESLLMWASYFRRGLIYGIDIYDKTSLSKGRVKVLQCSQIDKPRLTALGEEFGPFDFIIDDGSHLNAHQIETFKILWPFVKDGGAYIVEDVQTSYWPAFGGALLTSPEYVNTCMSYFKGLADCVNTPEFLEETGLDSTIGSISFHHNLIILTKDKSVRQSNLDLHELRATLLKHNPSVLRDGRMPNSMGL